MTPLQSLRKQVARNAALGLAATVLVAATVTPSTASTSGPDASLVPVDVVTLSDGTTLDEYREPLGAHHEVVALADADEVVATAVVLAGGSLDYAPRTHAAGDTYVLSTSAPDEADVPADAEALSEGRMLAAQLDLEARLEGRPVEVPAAVSHLLQVVDGRLVETAGASATPFASGSLTISNSKAYGYGAYRRYSGGSSGGKTYYNDESKLYGNSKSSDRMVHLSTQHVYLGSTSEVVDWSPSGRVNHSNCANGEVSLSFGGVTWKESYQRCASHHQGQTGQKYHYSTWYGEASANSSRSTANESLVSKSSGSSGFDYRIELRTCWWSCTTYKET